MKLLWSLLSSRDDALQRNSRRSRRKLITLMSTLRHHAQETRGAYTLCDCVGGIRGVISFSKLGRGRRRDYRWADRWQCYGRRPDVENRW